MTPPGTSSPFNLMGNFSWSSSSSSSTSTPQYSPPASFPLSREHSLTLLTPEFSSSPPMATTSGTAVTRATASAAATCFSAPTFDHVTLTEERIAAAGAAESKTSPKVVCSSTIRSSSNEADKCPSGVGATAGKTAVAGPLLSADALKIRPVANGEESVCDAASPHGRQPTAVGGTFRLHAASPPVDRLTFSAGRDASGAASGVIDIEGRQERGSTAEGHCFRRVRLIVSRLQPRAPLRDAAFASVSSGCYIFLLAASLRFFFHCIPDTKSPPLHAATNAEDTIVADYPATSSAPPFPPSFPDAGSRHPLTAGPSLPVPDEGGEPTLPPSYPGQHLENKPAFGFFNYSSPFSHSQRSSASRASRTASPSLHSTIAYTVVNPAPSSSSAFSWNAVPAAAATTNMPASSPEGLPEGTYYRVAYRLCAAWVAAGACGATAALLMYRSHGGIVTATSTLDVRFPVCDSASMDSEEAEAEEKEKAEREERHWRALYCRAAAQARETAEQQARSRDAEEGTRVNGIQATTTEAPHDKEKVDQGEYVAAEVPLQQQSGTSQQQRQQVRLHRQGHDRPQGDGGDAIVDLSQQQPDQQQQQPDQQQQQHDQQQQLGRQQKKDQEDGTGGGNADGVYGQFSGQTNDTYRSNEKYRRQSVCSGERNTLSDHACRRQGSLGISFLGQGQAGSIAAAIRRGSVASALSGGSSSSRTPYRLRSIGSNASRSSAGLALVFYKGAAIHRNSREIPCPSSGPSGAGDIRGGDALCAVTPAPDNAPIPHRHPGPQTSPAPQRNEQRSETKEAWLCRRLSRQQQQQQLMRQQRQRTQHQEQSDVRLVPLLLSTSLSPGHGPASFERRPSLGSWTASCVSMAIGGGLCACLQEFLLFLAVALERKRPIAWSVITCLSFSDWLMLELVASVSRYCIPLLPRWRVRGALLAAAANAVLLLLLRSVSGTSLTQHSQLPAGVQSSAETSKTDMLLHEAFPPPRPTEEASQSLVADQHATARLALGDYCGIVTFLVVAASVSALLADVSLASSFESGVSVRSTVVIRCFTQGAVGAAGILHGLVAGDLFLKGTDWWACSSALICPALAGLIFGPLAVYAFAHSVKHSSLLLGATVRSTCWVVVALLALVAQGQRLSSAFASALALTFAGTCLFAWDSKRGAHATRQDTGDNAYDCRISSAANEDDALTFPLYHELSEDGQCSQESSFSRMGNKSGHNSGSCSFRNV